LGFLSADVPDHTEGDAQYCQNDENNHNDKKSTVALAATDTTLAASTAKSRTIITDSWADEKLAVFTETFLINVDVLT